MNSEAEKLAWMILDQVRSILSDLPKEVKVLRTEHQCWEATKQAVGSVEILLPSGEQLLVRLITQALK